MLSSSVRVASGELPGNRSVDLPEALRRLRGRGVPSDFGPRNPQMNRSQLIARLAQQRESLPHGDVEAAVKTMLEHMTGHLADGGRIEIRGFGSFSVRYRRPRLMRDPRTGAAVAVPAQHAVHFKPGKALRERVDARGDGPPSAGDERRGFVEGRESDGR